MKTVFITGAARGIGKSAAIGFLKTGEWNVALGDMNTELLNKTCAELGETYGAGKVAGFTMDVTKRDSVKTAFDAAIAKFGQVHCLVNNAGITRDALSYKMTEEAFDMVIAVNLKGVFNCCQAITPHMMEKGGGSIINTSSVVGLYGNVGQANYVATKAGIIGMTKTLAKELGRKGIRVNAVAPGFTATEMVETVPQKILDDLKSKTPLQRLGNPEDIANAYIFLASDQSAFITGHCLQVDGGLVL